MCHQRSSKRSTIVSNPVWPSRPDPNPELSGIPGAVHGRAYQRRILLSEFEATRTFKRHDERPAQIAFLFPAICKTAPKTLLDVGCRISPLSAMIADCGISVTAIDNVRDYWTRGMLNRHWLVIDDDIQASVCLTSIISFVRVYQFFRVGPLTDGPPSLSAGT
jgi:hypothetical protein